MSLITFFSPSGSVLMNVQTTRRCARADSSSSSNLLSVGHGGPISLALSACIVRGQAARKRRSVDASVDTIWIRLVRTARVLREVVCITRSLSSATALATVRSAAVYSARAKTGCASLSTKSARPCSGSLVKTWKGCKTELPSLCLISARLKTSGTP